VGRNPSILWVLVRSDHHILWFWAWRTWWAVLHWLLWLTRRPARFGP